MLLNVLVLIGVLAAVGVPAPLTFGAVVVALVVLRVAGGPFTARFRKTEHRFSDEARPDGCHARPLAALGRLDRQAAAEGLDRDDAAARRDGARPAELLVRPDAGQLVPR